MTALQVVTAARRASVRAERELAEARRSGDVGKMRLARLHWECTLRDLHRVLLAVGQ